MTTTRLNQIARVNRLIKRQSCSSWTENYQPGTRATREEAPRISNPRIFKAGIKTGRDMHAHSSIESRAMLAALYRRNVIDVHEQKVLRFNPSPNPMTNHPNCNGSGLPPLPGMYSVYQALGEAENYPRIRLKAAEPIPILLEGDMLLYVTDEHGLHCVNWTVKRKSDQFGMGNIENHPALQTETGKRKAFVRHAAEKAYYAQAQIPTYRITEETFTKTYCDNLEDCYTGRSRITQFLKPYLAEAADLLDSIIGTLETPRDVGEYVCSKYGLRNDQWMALFYSLVWEQRIQVDLEQRIFIDGPLTRPSFGTDKYAPLFARII